MVRHLTQLLTLEPAKQHGKKLMLNPLNHPVLLFVISMPALWFGAAGRRDLP